LPQVNGKIDILAQRLMRRRRLVDMAMGRFVWKDDDIGPL